MPTTVHLPDALLEGIDRCARDLGLSRNRYIVQALTQSLERRTGWSVQFVETMTAASDDTEAGELAAEMLEEILRARARKPAAEL